METFCSEFQGDRMQHAIITDLSAGGLCMFRPLGGRHGRTIPVEFEIPEIDEVMWALGEVCFDEVKHAPPGCTIGIAGMVRSTGLKLVGAAERHKRILREYVMDTWRTEDADVNDNWLMTASCYRS
ncbi:MAG: PilZ domain-containing protein [Myxococcales bacterium]|nr:PilZ domain-containing protein [Myxococcales bacterium]